MLKSEPSTFSFEDLLKSPQQSTLWEGVRNYQARNYLREMEKSDLAFFYHSSCPSPGIAGIVEIIKTAQPDPSAYDPKSPYYDPNNKLDNPRWFVVTVKALRPLKRFITLEELRSHPQLEDMTLLKKGNRLSVFPIAKKEWSFVLSLE
jgi:predicted RNA-binding protein with PUA-like domain